MLSTFYDKKCTIQEITFTNLNWIEKKETALLYENIACDFWEKLWGYSSNDKAKEEDWTWYVLMLQPFYTNIKKWQQVELADDMLWKVWDYVIEKVLPLRLPNWIIESIQVSLKNNIWL